MVQYKEEFLESKLWVKHFTTNELSQPQPPSKAGAISRSTLLMKNQSCKKGE